MIKAKKDLELEAIASAPTKESLKSKGKQRQLDSDGQQVTGRVDSDGEGSSSSSSDAASVADDDSEAEQTTAEADTKPLDLEKIRKRTHYAIRQMSQKAKQARNFEIQRLVKRLKSCPAPEKPPLEVQLASMKAMDLHSLAASALLSKLGKAKLIPRGAGAGAYKTEQAKLEQMGVEEWPAMAGVWSQEVLASVWVQNDPAAAGNQDETAKAKAKVLSHKLLAEESMRLTEILGRLAGREKLTKPVEEKHSAAVQDEEEREWSGSEEEGEDEQELETDSDSEDEDQLDEAAVRERIEQLGDLDKWDALVAAGSSGEEEDDEGDDQKEQDRRKRKRSASPADRAKSKKKAAVQSPEPSVGPESESDSSEQSGSDSDSDASSASSHFLPALSHGFLTHSLRTKDDDFSGSENDDQSDFSLDSDAEDRVQGAAKGSKKSSAATRKNRMGQRARKALWEKKYGKNANHVKLRMKEERKQQRQGQPPNSENGYKPLRRGRDGKVLPDFNPPDKVDSGWKKFPVKSEKTEESRTLPPQKSTTMTERAAPPARLQQYRQPQSHQPPPKTEGPPAGELHPSWVAKQKQKEKEEAIAKALKGGGGAGAGKKVLFG